MQRVTALATDVASAPRDVLIRSKAKINAATGIPGDVRTLDL